MWHVCGLVFLILALVTFMIIVQPDPNRKPPPGQVVPRSVPYDRRPWNGQQHVEQTGCASLFDVEYDKGHSGFLGNANYKAPPFIAGMSAMHQDF